MVTSGLTHCGSSVIQSPAAAAAGSAPPAAARSRSRSVRMPTGRLASVITTDPTPWSCIRWATVSKVSSRKAVMAGIVMASATVLLAFVVVMGQSSLYRSSVVNVDSQSIRWGDGGAHMDDDAGGGPATGSEAPDAVRLHQPGRGSQRAGTGDAHQSGTAI